MPLVHRAEAAQPRDHGDRQQSEKPSVIKRSAILLVVFEAWRRGRDCILKNTPSATFFDGQLRRIVKKTSLDLLPVTRTPLVMERSTAQSCLAPPFSIGYSASRREPYCQVSVTAGSMLWRADEYP